MLEVPVFKIKEEEAFTLNGIYIDNAFSLIRRLSKSYKLVHIFDLDAQKGKSTNFSVYDQATYYMHIQLDLVKEKLYDKLISLNVRITVPAKETNVDKSFMIAKIFKEEEVIFASKFKDILTNDQLADMFSNNRVFVYGTNNEHFARINPELWTITRFNKI